MFWIAGCSPLRAVGFSCTYCSLVVLYRGLEISKLQFLIKKNIIFFFSFKFFKIFCLQNPGSKTGSESVSASGSAIRKNAGSGSGINQCESPTLSTGSPTTCGVIAMWWPATGFPSPQSSCECGRNKRRPAMLENVERILKETHSWPLRCKWLQCLSPCGLLDPECPPPFDSWQVEACRMLADRRVVMETNPRRDHERWFLSVPLSTIEKTLSLKCWAADKYGRNEWAVIGETGSTGTGAYVRMYSEPLQTSWERMAPRSMYHMWYRHL